MAEPARPNTDRVEKLTYSVSDLLQQVALLQEELRVVVARAEGERGSLRQATCIFEEVAQRATERHSTLEGRVAELEEALNSPEQWRGALKKADERLTILEFDREAAVKASLRHEAGAQALCQRLDELEATVRQEARARSPAEDALHKLSVQVLELECRVLKSDSELKATVATNTHQAQECSEGIAGLKLRFVETSDGIAGLKRSLVETHQDVASLKHGLVETCEDIAGLKRSLSDAVEQARVFQVDIQDLRCQIGESTERGDALESLDVLRVASVLQTPGQRSLASRRQQGVQSSLAVQHRIDELKLVVGENAERGRACLRDIEGLKLALGESSKTSTACQRNLEEVHAHLRRQEVLSQSLGTRSTALERGLRQCATDLKVAVLLSFQRGKETQQNLSDLRVPLLDGQGRLRELEQSLERLCQQESQSQRDVQELRELLRPRDPRQWSECQLAHWLARRGLPAEVAQALEVHLVNGVVGPDLAEEDLAAMGIVDSLLQRRVLCELRGLFCAGGDAKPALGAAPPHETTALARTLAPRVLRPQSARVGNTGGLQSLRKHCGARAPSSQRRRSPQEAATLALTGGLRMPLGRRCVPEAPAEDPLTSSVELEKSEEKSCLKSEALYLGELRGEVLQKLEDLARRLESSEQSGGALKERPFSPSSASQTTRAESAA